MGQRTDNFAGGIQDGSTPQLNDSVSLEPALRAATAKLATTRDDVNWRYGITAAELADRLGVPTGHICGASPDGGIWYDATTGVPLVATEAKKQGGTGNAIERWYKNAALFARLGVGVYLTVCSGEGFFDRNTAQRTMELAVALHPDEAHRLEDNTVWNTPTGSLWLYRYRDEADAGDLGAVLNDAIEFATATQRLRLVPAA